MAGSSHAISVSIDTNRLVDQHSFQRTPSRVPMASFPTINLFRDLKGVSWYGTCGSQKNWQMDKEDVNDLLIHPRAFANLTNHSNQQ